MVHTPHLRKEKEKVREKEKVEERKGVEVQVRTLVEVVRKVKWQQE
jgi:hypothetical protein